MSALTVDDVIGGNVCRRREELRMSQSALSTAIEAHGVRIIQRQISEIENGRRPLKMTEAFVIAHALGVRPGQLLDGVSAEWLDCV